MTVDDKCFNLEDGSFKYPAKTYFNDEFLQYNERVHNWYNFGGLIWHQVLCLLAAWILICISFIVNRKGKVIYFMAIAPILILFILMIYGATLDGAGSGLKLYVLPKWKHFGDAQVLDKYLCSRSI